MHGAGMNVVASDPKRRCCIPTYSVAGSHHLQYQFTLTPDDLITLLHFWVSSPMSLA